MGVEVAGALEAAGVVLVVAGLVESVAVVVIINCASKEMGYSSR